MALALTACGVSASEPADSVARTPISGGDAAALGAWPMVVWLDNGCTGVLLANDLVVFAAHCGAAASTAWLGDELSVSVDENAGTVHVEGGAGAREIRTLSCEVNPNSELGTPTDVGFCRLQSKAVPEAQIIHPLQGCAEAALAIGNDATLVGFGRDSALDPPGLKRTTLARVQTVMPDFEIGDSNHGTCAGDSGSPAFVRVGSDGHAEWAVAGILSGGPRGEACGMGYYAQLAAALPWLERTSGVDLSPCFDDGGAWAPSAGCTKPNVDESGLAFAGNAAADALCGAPFVASTGSEESSADGGCALGGGRLKGDRTPCVSVLALACLFVARRKRVRTVG